jgi:N6-adenosine-specific RNA methylase IME4
MSTVPICSFPLRGLRSRRLGEHSAKPEEVRRRIERLFPGPYLELYGRKLVPGWTVWGNEIRRNQFVREVVA